MTIHDRNYISHQEQKQDPASKIKQGYIQHNASHSKETKKYMITLHIPHILELFEEKDGKLMDLVLPSIWWHWISWKRLLTHWMLTLTTPLSKVAEKWNGQMENMNTLSNSWHQIVQNSLSNFWILTRWNYGATRIF